MMECRVEFLSSSIKQHGVSRVVIFYSFFSALWYVLFLTYPPTLPKFLSGFFWYVFQGAKFCGMQGLHQLCVEIFSANPLTLPCFPLELATAAQPASLRSFVMMERRSVNLTLKPDSQSTAEALPLPYTSNNFFKEKGSEMDGPLKWI